MTTPSTLLCQADFSLYGVPMTPRRFLYRSLILSLTLVAWVVMPAQWVVQTVVSERTFLTYRPRFPLRILSVVSQKGMLMLRCYYR